MIRKLPAVLCLLALLAPPLATVQAQLPLALTPAAPATPATPAASTPTTNAPTTNAPTTNAPTTNAPTTNANGVATPTATAPAITPEQAQQALDVLNDPAKRAEITTTLEVIARAKPAGATPATPTPAPGRLGIPLTPDSVGADMLVSAANSMNQFANRVSELAHAAQGLPLLWDWAVTMSTDPEARMLLADLAWRLALALAVSFAVLWGLSRIFRPPLRAVDRRLIRMPPTAPIRQPPEPTGDDAGDEPGDRAADPAADPPGGSTESGEARAEHGETEPPVPHRFDAARLLRRVPLVLAEVALSLLPIVGFVVAGHLIAGSALGGTRLTRLVLLAVVDSYAVCAALLRLAHALLSPRRRLRLLPVPDATAAYALRWTQRLLVVSVVGYAIAEVGLLLGLSQAAHLTLLKGTALLLHIFIGIIIVQQRRVVRRWIRAPAGAQGIVAGVRNRLAAIWHWIALFYLVALWLVWAAALPAGYERVSRAALVTVAVLVLGRATAQACIAGLDRAVSAGSELATRYPGLDRRLTMYHPLLRVFVQVGVFLLGVLVFLQLLGFAVLQWLIANPLGQRVVGSLTMLAVTILLALAAWEAVNIAIERRLSRLTQRAEIATAARLRSLLPFMRAAVLVVVLTITVLMVLSEIGVNTAPLLASAGIIGVAIGFGSQKLVQDLITGLFLLLENAMQVGDTVTVSGLSGTVEHLSVRTIRLRASDGSVHIIPFSSVTSVTNINRGQGNAAVVVTVAWHEDTDQVCEALRALAAELRAAPAFASDIMSDLQLWGVDRFDGASATITGQIICTDTGRWPVQREFNRRVKMRFEELGIQLFNPTRSLMVPADGVEHAKPAPDVDAKPAPDADAVAPK